MVTNKPSAKGKNASEATTESFNEFSSDGFISLFFANKITVQLESYVNDYPFVLRKRIKVISNILKKPLKNYKTPELESNKVSMAGRLSLQKNFTPLLEQIK